MANTNTQNCSCPHCHNTACDGKMSTIKQKICVGKLITVTAYFNKACTSGRVQA